MPYVRKYRARRRKRPYTKRKRVYSNHTNVHQRKRGNTFPLSNSLSTKLIYSQQQAVNATPVADYLFSGNSLYDPFQSGAGSQPMGFDELMAFYEKFQVGGCKVHATYINTSSTPIEIAIVPSNDNASITSMENARAMAGAVSRVVVPASSQSRPMVLKLYKNSRHVLGITKAGLSDDDYSGSATANPLEQWWFHFITYSLDGSSNHTGYWQIKLTYYARFSDRKNLALS